MNSGRSCAQVTVVQKEDDLLRYSKAFAITGHAMFQMDLVCTRASAHSVRTKSPRAMPLQKGLNFDAVELAI